MTETEREAAIDVADERRSANHQ